MGGFIWPTVHNTNHLPMGGFIWPTVHNTNHLPMGIIFWPAVHNTNHLTNRKLQRKSFPSGRLHLASVHKKIIYPWEASFDLQHTTQIIYHGRLHLTYSTQHKSFTHRRLHLAHNTNHLTNGRLHFVYSTQHKSFNKWEASFDIQYTTQNITSTFISDSLWYLSCLQMLLLLLALLLLMLLLLKRKWGWGRQPHILHTSGMLTQYTYCM